MQFSPNFVFETQPIMREVLAKMRECGKEGNMLDFPHDCGMVDTYGNTQHLPVTFLTVQKSRDSRNTMMTKLTMK